MYDRLPTVLSSQELLDVALGRAAKVQKEDRDVVYRTRKTIQARVETTTENLLEHLERYIKGFPNLERVSTYERELIDIVVGVAGLHRALGRLQGSIETIVRLGRDATGELRRAGAPGALGDVHNGYVGRVASVIERLGPSLDFLRRARDSLRALPDITPDDPTIVLGGYPNVGKSSLLAMLTRARPEIAPYPFTTKHANVGHFLWPPKGGRRAKRYQVVDTPGLLEKPPEERKAIERQAALALGYLADVVLFVHDMTEQCGYTRDQQAALLASIRQEFPNAPILEVRTKADLAQPKDASLPPLVSGKTGEGVEDLKRRLVEAVPPDPYAGLLASPEPVERT